MSIVEYAAASGISRQRVNKLVIEGVIQAERVGQVWVIPERELNVRRNISRPLSHRVMRHVAAAIEEGATEFEELSPGDRHLLKSHIKKLKCQAEPERLIASWFQSRHDEVQNLRVQPADLVHARNDRRIVLSGISDPRSGLSSGGSLEAYVGRDDLDDYVGDYLLVRSGSSNVRLHITAETPIRPIPLAYVAADLADWNLPREQMSAHNLLAELWNR